MSAQLCPYGQIGADKVAAITGSFYDLVESDPAFSRLHAMHGADMAPVRDGFERFLTGWLGGPRDWFMKGQCVMALHAPMAIDAALAQEWTDAMSAAIAEQDWEDPSVPDRLEHALVRMARSMIRKH